MTLVTAFTNFSDIRFLSFVLPLYGIQRGHLGLLQDSNFDVLTTFSSGRGRTNLVHSSSSLDSVILLAETPSGVSRIV